MAITKITGEITDLADLSADLGAVYTLRASGDGTARQLQLVANAGGGSETVVSEIDLTSLIPTYTISISESGTFPNETRVLNLEAQYPSGTVATVASIDLSSVYGTIGDIGQ